MANFDPIAAASLENVNVVWTTTLAGTAIDPVAGAMAVKMAFPVSSGNPRLPAQAVTWFAAAWLGGTTLAGFVAQCLVGPGGAVTLTAGQTYDVWSWVTGSPEIPKQFAGQLAVY